jgi:hypothetical protein
LLWKIYTRSKVRRSNLIKLVTTESLVNIINSVAQEKQEAEVKMQPERRHIANIPPQQPTVVKEEEQLVRQAEGQTENQVETQEDIQENEDEESSSSEQVIEHSQGVGVITTRSDRQIIRPSGYATETKVAHLEWGKGRQKRQ